MILESPWKVFEFDFDKWARTLVCDQVCDKFVRVCDQVRDSLLLWRLKVKAQFSMTSLSLDALWSPFDPENLLWSPANIRIPYITSLGYIFAADSVYAYISRVLSESQNMKA